jgi:hypothetical protein
MPDEKKPCSRKSKSAEAIMARTHGESLSALLKGLMDWHLSKINGDPQTEGFDLLLMSDGPGGGVGCKYVLGSFEEAKDRLKADLETTHVGAVMYAYSYKGYWRAPDGAKRGGAIVTVESNELKPAVIGYEIAADAEGRSHILGGMHQLSFADWSLFHRAK